LAACKGLGTASADDDQGQALIGWQGSQSLEDASQIFAGFDIAHIEPIGFFWDGRVGRWLGPRVLVIIRGTRLVDDLDAVLDLRKIMDQSIAGCLADGHHPVGFGKTGLGFEPVNLTIQPRIGKRQVHKQQVMNG
jgi:hypothetical protein